MPGMYLSVAKSKSDCRSDLGVGAPPDRAPRGRALAGCASAERCRGPARAIGIAGRRSPAEFRLNLLRFLQMFADDEQRLGREIAKVRVAAFPARLLELLGVFFVVFHHVIDV